MTTTSLQAALDGSRAFGVCKNAVERARSSTSRLPRAAVGGSRTVERCRRYVDGARSGFGDSAVGQAGRYVAAASDRAAVTAIAERSARVVRASWLYRWFTADPDPDVVVIDLRETVTVAPFIVLLHAAVDAIVAALPRSIAVGVAERTESSLPDEPVRNASILALGVVVLGLLVAITRSLPDVVLLGLAFLALMAAVGTRVRLSLAELRETRAARLLEAALEPPEPPDSSEPPDSARPDDSAGADDSTGGRDTTR